jgi:hypothetical protein
MAQGRFHVLGRPDVGVRRDGDPTDDDVLNASSIERAEQP